MVDRRRQLILAMVGVVVFVFGFVYYVWRNSLQTPLPAPSESFPTARIKAPTSGAIFNPPPYFPGTHSVLKPTEVGTDFEESIAPLDFEALFGTIQNTFQPPSQTLPSPRSFPSLQPPASPPPSEIVITPQEFFEFAYPPNIRKVLQDFNQVMIEDEFLSPGEIYPLTSMKEAEIFQDKIADYLIYLSANSENSSFSRGEIELYKKAYHEILPRLWEEELRMRKAATQSSFQPLKFWANYRSELLHKEAALMLDSLSKRLQSFFWVVTYAQISVGTECYREGLSVNPLLGSETAAPCCNCGYVRRSRGRWRFVYDCGESGCTINLGCLNEFCPGLPAIWDPMTLICGCDI